MLLCRVLAHRYASSVTSATSVSPLSSLLGVNTLVDSRGSGFHTSSHVMGLEEFFPKTKNIIEESEKTGKEEESRNNKWSVWMGQVLIN